MRLNSSQLIKPCGTLTASSPGTESVGLRADAHGVMVFAIPSRLFHRAPGLTILTRNWCHRDYFIVHPDSPAVCQDLQKPRHRDTDGNSPNRRAVSTNISACDKYAPRTVFICFHLDIKIQQPYLDLAIARRQTNTCANSRSQYNAT